LVFKDLQKVVHQRSQQQQQEKTNHELFERLQNKPFCFVDDAVRFVMAHNDSNNENLIGDKVNKLSTFHGEESTTSNIFG